ncbi:hypothetical protein L915_17700 [Phytophthora nicotianae]|uniref:Uncharacterized protein n=2 Tax=Phytophthora nicotianae TaxID=4792 RepID=W2FY96_PHYNI|nr:hypothetical protein L915_17700 [Phytophthora nicotianae]
MEEDEASSSLAAESKAAETTPDPLTGSRRTRDDDPGASSSKRPRTGEEAQQPPVLVTPFSRLALQVMLRGCLLAINDDAEAANMHFDPSTNQRRDYYIGLFHELRWYASKKTSRKSKVPEWVAPCQSWNAFVVNFNNDAKAYRERITAARQRFETFSGYHMIDRLHSEAVSAGIPCAVPYGTAYSHCWFGAVRLSERDLLGCTGVRVPASLRELRAPRERRDALGATSRSIRAGTIPTFGSGPHTPSPFPECPPSGRSAVPMYLGGEEILSNEYEDEPDLGSSSGLRSPLSARQSNVSSRVRPAAAVAEVERYPSYGQPQVDHGSHTLLERVAALEQSQSAELAALQQELRILRAQIATAAQTTSDIQVELGSKLVRLSDRVVALEKQTYAASSSSSSH